MHPNFEHIVNCVRTVNPTAAKVLLSYTYLHRKTTRSLNELMCWQETGQGHQFWAMIARKIDYSRPTRDDPKDGLTPVQRRCKKLWNNSNYVKNNPQRAY